MTPELLKLVKSIPDIKYILDTFFLLFSGALVMWMAAGFAMLEAGLVRTKNTTGILTKNIALYAIACVAYYLIGYNLMYGAGANSFIGSGFALSGFDLPGMGDGHSRYADFFFQVVFVATAASIVSGTVAERMKFWPFILFVVVLSSFIYPIQGHWTWGMTSEIVKANGIMVKILGEFWKASSDFAGSTVVHSVGGWAALAGALLLGPRLGKYGKDGKVNPIPGANLPLATIGTFILWFGWFGFNGGSQLTIATKGDITAVSQVFVNTNMGAAAGAIMGMILTQLLYKKVDLTMVLNGALAGLVAITAGPDYPAIWQALLIGAIGGTLVVFAVPFFDKIKIDDPVGALSVHLVNGIWGTLAVGIFNPAVSIIGQIKLIVVVGLFTFVTSFITWAIIKAVFGLRVSAEEEYEGMDVAEFGLHAYPEFVERTGSNT
ncbi:MAG: Amt family ammonium transporter [bacterium]|jgi:Amt family ammonium transporter